MHASLTQHVPNYYYNITGDVQMGDNKNLQQYTSYATSRFPINAPQDILTQAAGWAKQYTGHVSTLRDTTPGIVPAQFAAGKSTPVAFNA